MLLKTKIDTICSTFTATGNESFLCPFSLVEGDGPGLMRWPSCGKAHLWACRRGYELSLGVQTM